MASIAAESLRWLVLKGFWAKLIPGAAPVTVVGLKDGFSLFRIIQTRAAKGLYCNRSSSPSPWGLCKLLPYRILSGILSQWVLNDSNNGAATTSFQWLFQNLKDLTITTFNLRFPLFIFFSLLLNYSLQFIMNISPPSLMFTSFKYLQVVFCP